jgi:signal transduction histidine kinase
MKNLFFLLLLFLQAQAHALVPGYTVERAYWHDAQNQAAMEDMAQAPFAPFVGRLRLGLQQGATWVRFRIHRNDPSDQRAVAAPDNPLILRVGPYTLDHVDLYENYAGKWQVSHAGDRQTRRIDKCPDDLHCFSLQTHGQDEGTIYVKVQTQGMRLIESELTFEDTLALAVAPRVARTSTALALSNGLLLLGLLVLLTQRTRLLQFYCVYQASVVVQMYASSGMLAHRFLGFAPALLDTFGNLFQVMRVLAVVLIGWAAIAQFQTSRTYRRLLGCLLAMCGANAVLVAAGYAHLGLSLNLLVLAVNPAVQLYGASRMPAHTLTLKKIIFVAYFCYGLALSVGSIGAFGLVPDSALLGTFQSLTDWRLNGLAVGIFVLVFLNSEQASKKLLELREVQALRIEALQAKAQREILKERNTLIDVLTHELRTPLGTMRFALASLKRDKGTGPDSLKRIKHIDASVNRMDAVIEQVAASVKLEEANPPLLLEKIPAHALIGEIVQDRPSFDRFRLDVPPDATFRTDRHLLLQIVENLVSNAEKYAAPGDILIAVRPSRPRASEVPAPPGAYVRPSAGPALCLEIRNPVAPENAPDATRLFERYYRHPNVLGLPGIGIGLNLVKTAADNLGATVNYRFENGWAIFELRIPS